MMTTEHEMSVQEFAGLVEYEGGLRELYDHGLDDDDVPTVLRGAWEDYGEAIFNEITAEIVLARLIDRERRNA